ncbi:MAG TPA: anti-sigma regulatory factor [Candidatus Manganitrophaceae bacterium]|nr:anti-sigma regulatory factor [Candidatus Manganitrophaceae bacterium]
MVAKRPISLPITNELDIVKARQEVRSYAQSLGFSLVDQTRVTTAVSELVRNIVKYAVKGTLDLEMTEKGARKGLRIVCRDEGPGIPDIELAMKEGYTTGKGLGYGLPGAKRLVDQFEIWSEVGKGTRVTIIKWQ